MRHAQSSRAFVRSALRVAALAAVCCATAAPAQFEGMRLGAPPRLEVSQDTSAWARPLAPKVAPSRADVVRLYQTKYEPSGAVALA